MWTQWVLVRKVDPFCTGQGAQILGSRTANPFLAGLGQMAILAILAQNRIGPERPSVKSPRNIDPGNHMGSSGPL
jgi:hypothetical protein